MTHRLQYITRFAYPGSGRPHWWVRFVRHGVIVVNERFYDSDLGGARRSLVAAKEFRDRILEREPLLLPRGYRHQPHRSRRGFHYSEYRHGDRLRRYWVAGWQDDGRRRVRRFEITAGRPFYMAPALAKEWRELMITQCP